MATKEALGKTEQINGRRYYNVEEGTQYPSVTTILGAFADQSGLDKWRKRVGEAEANRISKFSANRGTVMHQLCEYYILSEKPTPKEKREAPQISRKTKGEEKGGQTQRPGDWYRPSCSDLQFARNQACRRCWIPWGTEEHHEQHITRGNDNTPTNTSNM